MTQFTRDFNRKFDPQISEYLQMHCINMKLDILNPENFQILKLNFIYDAKVAHMCSTDLFNNVQCKLQCYREQLYE